MSNLVEHAKRELIAAGYDPQTDDPLDMGIYQTTLRIVQEFASVGHSGSSAEMHATMIEKLLRWQPLTPLTDDPLEWLEVTWNPDYPSWQNRRRPDAFSDDGGKTYYSVDEFRYEWRAKLFGRIRKYYKTQPHTQEVQA